MIYDFIHKAYEKGVNQLLVVNEIKINGIGGIDKLELKFNKRLNLICGPNGVGKTTILESIAEFFSQGYFNILKRNVNYQQGDCKIIYSINQKMFHEETYIKTNYLPTDNPTWHGSNPEAARELIVFKAERALPYTQLGSINRDQEKTIDNFFQASASGTQINDFKNWFLNRYLFNFVPDQLNENQKSNLQLAIDCFGILDSRVKFSSVVHETFDIIVNTPNGNIYFEYLSSGFKSCIYIIQGLIKEIEFRFQSQGGINVQNFEGLILIDELDLHLHPQWQAKLIYLMKSIFPKAQIIATTHSPHMIQAAEINEIIALGLNEQDQVFVRELPNTDFGFQGWTVEEILEDVMGLTETKSVKYIEAINDFERAMNEENEKMTAEAYSKLDSMLHPNNPLRKLLKLQIAQFGGYKID
jgi:predicted ATP-binding protein involved in virulence